MHEHPSHVKLGRNPPTCCSTYICFGVRTGRAARPTGINTFLRTNNACFLVCTGTIPVQLGTLTALRHLYLHHNALKGECRCCSIRLPQETGIAASLHRLRLISGHTLVCLIFILGTSTFRFIWRGPFSPCVPYIPCLCFCGNEHHRLVDCS